jgi:uncharacterized protein (TIGR00304 family)
LTVGRKTLDALALYSIGIILIVAGILIIIVAVILSSVGSPNKGNVRGGGIIMIGPVPIIFGTDRKSLKTVASLAVALMVIALIIMVLCWLLR